MICPRDIVSAWVTSASPRLTVAMFWCPRDSGHAFTGQEFSENNDCDARVNSCGKYHQRSTSEKHA